MPRLSSILREQGLSGGAQKRALESGKVLLDGTPTADAGREVEPDRVRYVPQAPRIRPGRDLAVLHRDDQVVVVWKPPELLSVPARNRPDGHISVLSVVSQITGRQALAVHRIDAPTSGLMMVALKPKAQLILKEQLELHSVERRYLAIVSGHPPEGPITHDTVIVRNRGDGLRGSAEVWGRYTTARDPGRQAITHVGRLAIVDRRCSLVEATLETGRTHQVRIHLAEAGFPILGDPLYATAQVSRRAPRLALHASVLGFVHPTTGEALRFTSPLPDDLERLRRSLVHEQAHGTEAAHKGSQRRPARQNRRKSPKGRGKR